MSDKTPVSDSDAALDLRVLPGSDRGPAPRAQALARVPAQTPVTATVVLRPGSSQGDLTGAAAVLEGLGITISESHAPSRRLRISAPAEVAERVFATQLSEAESDGPDGQRVRHRHRTGSLSVPASLDGLVVAVLGLDDRPQARPRLRTAAPMAARTSYTPVQLGELYRFPAGTDGTGTTIAIIELGGGFRPADLDTYFVGLGTARPTVTAVGVDGAGNAPGGDAQGADGEVLLDIEVVGGLAPGAAQLVYFAPNTDAGFLDAVSTAAAASPPPVAISISWGAAEDAWTGQARSALDAAFADATAAGIVVTVAAGDNGSADGVSGVHTDFPASSPHALACGGTSLQASGSAIKSETVWNDGSGGGSTGGGVSTAFERPSWQAGAGVPARPGTGGSGRGVPDVAANADPATGYEVLVDGSRAVYGGTSAVAPLWAALVARLVQATGQRLGSLHEQLYAGVAPGRPVPGFRDITAGSNGAYAANPGWDACTGLGSPDGEALLARLRASPSSGAARGPAAGGGMMP